MKKIQFIDLEDTVIDVFRSDSLVRRAVNHARVRKFLQGQQADEHRLFSFALSNEADIRLYQNWWQAFLDKGLGIQMNMCDVFTTEKLFLLCKRQGLVFEDEHECMLFHGKQYGFQHYIEMSPEFDNSEVTLLDDSVQNITIHYANRNLTLRMVNVADLPE